MSIGKIHVKTKGIKHGQESCQYLQTPSPTKQCIAAGKIQVKLIINKTLGQGPNNDSILELKSTLHRAEEKSENH